MMGFLWRHIGSHHGGRGILGGDPERLLGRIASTRAGANHMGEPAAGNKSCVCLFLVRVTLTYIISLKTKRI